MWEVFKSFITWPKCVWFGPCKDCKKFRTDGK